MFITDASEFQKAKRHVYNAICDKAALPKQVFVIPYSNFLFVEDVELSTPDFSSAIMGMMQHSNESSAISLMMNPDPEIAVHAEAGYYPCFNFTTSTDPEVIHDLYMHSGSQKWATQMGLIYHHHAIVGDSLKWAIFFDRAFELGVVAATEPEILDAFRAKAGGLFPHFDAEGAISSVLVNSINAIQHPEIVAEFRANYKRSI